MHQHSFVLNCSQWVPCWGMWIWMAPLFWRLNCNYPDVIGNLVLTLPSKIVFLYLCMAPMVHLLSYTQSNLFGSQTPMSHPENREERTLLPSNQWNVTTLDKSNQYCSKYWTLRWWKNSQSYVHNSSTLSFPTLSSGVKPTCALTILETLQRIVCWVPQETPSVIIPERRYLKSKSLGVWSLLPTLAVLAGLE